MSSRATSTRWAAGAVVSAASLIVSGCGSSVQTSDTTSYDMPTFSSFDEVANVADIVVVARVTDETVEVTDTGGNDLDDEALANGGAIEQRLVRVSIRDAIHGNPGADEIWVVQPKMESEKNTLLRPGSSVVLALDEQTTENAPSVFQEVGSHWAPVSLDFGIARLDGQRLIPFVEGMDARDVSGLAAALE